MINLTQRQSKDMYTEKSAEEAVIDLDILQNNLSFGLYQNGVLCERMLAYDVVSYQEYLKHSSQGKIK